MEGLLPQLGLVVGLVLVNAAFAGTEMALVSLREGQLRQLENESRSGVVLARLARDPNRFLATIQVGITLAGLLASAAAAVAIAERLRQPLDFLGGAAEPAAVVTVTIVLAYLTLVVGELAPKRVAMQRAERWGLVAARPLAVLSRLTRPAVWLLSHSTDVAVRLMGGDPSRQREQVTAEEIRNLVAAQTTFTPKQRRIIDGAFGIADRTLLEVLRPRPGVFVLDANQSSSDAIRVLAASGHSRAPVVDGGSLDDVIGVVHLRDLLDHRDPVRELVGEIPALPETVGVLDALHEMQARRSQLAVVIDEHGSASGIVTVEDLVEEIVGEIYDESDRDVLAVRRDPDGSLVLRGQFPVHDLRDLGVFDVPDGPYATVAGFVIDRLGRIPDAPGDRVESDGWRFEVTAVGRHAVTEVRVTRLPAASLIHDNGPATRAGANAQEG